MFQRYQLFNIRTWSIRFQLHGSNYRVLWAFGTLLSHWHHLQKEPLARRWASFNRKWWMNDVILQNDLMLQKSCLVIVLCQVLIWKPKLYWNNHGFDKTFSKRIRDLPTTDSDRSDENQTFNKILLAALNLYLSNNSFRKCISNSIVFNIGKFIWFTQIIKYLI